MVERRFLSGGPSLRETLLILGDIEMKFGFIKSAVVAAAMLAPISAQAATAVGTADAEILADISVTQTQGLNFGQIAIGTSGGNVDVNFSDAQACSGGLVCAGGSATGAFTIAGVTGLDVEVVVDSAVTLTRVGATAVSPGVFAALDQMAASLTSNTTALTLDGTDGFKVGGTLTVNAAQTAGAYTGSYNVTVTYN
jgi:Domain of unknown function (DUF4402)